MNTPTLQDPFTSEETITPKVETVGEVCTNCEGQYARETRRRNRFLNEREGARILWVL